MSVFLTPWMAAPPKQRSPLVDSEASVQFAEAFLGGRPWFGGAQFSGADIMMLFALTTMRRFAQRDISGLPNLQAYLERIGARPAYRRAMAKADPNVPPNLT